MGISYAFSVFFPEDTQQQLEIVQEVQTAEEVILPEPKSTEPMEITITEEISLQVKHTCNGLDINPRITVSHLPETTETLVVIVQDQTENLFLHWLAWNITPKSIPSDLSIGEYDAGTNDFNKVGYNGPCPQDSQTHEYIFKVYALDTTLDIPVTTTRKQLLDSIKSHILDEDSITLEYTQPLDK